MISHALVKLFDSSTNETIAIVSKNFTVSWRKVRNEQQGAGTVRKLSTFESWVDVRVVMWHNSVRTNVQLHTGQSTESFAKCHRPNNQRKESLRVPCSTIDMTNLDLTNRQRNYIVDSESRFETSIIFDRYWWARTCSWVVGSGSHERNANARWKNQIAISIFTTGPFCCQLEFDPARNCKELSDQGTQTPCHLIALVQSFTQMSCYSSAF